MYNIYLYKYIDNKMFKNSNKNTTAVGITTSNSL